MRISTRFFAIAMLLALVASILPIPPASVQEAHAALPANELWRENLVNNVVGFGKNTTGGQGGTLCVVTNLNDSGSGSLRKCAEEIAGPLWIVFDVSGTINSRSPIYITANKTVDGRGADITINGCGFEIGQWSKRPNPSQNVIIENLKFEQMMSAYLDCISYVLVSETAANVWIDHNTFKESQEETIFVGSNGADGGSVGAPPSGVTISWNHFAFTDFGGGPGGGADVGCQRGWCDKAIDVSDISTPIDQAVTITSHHNYHEHTHVRNPATQQAKFHAFNNYLTDNNVGEQDSNNGQLYSENEIFECHGSNDYPRVKVLPGAANVKVTGEWRVCGTEIIEQLNPGTIFDPHAFYTYTPDTANAALRTAIINNAGWQNVTAPSPTPTVSPTPTPTPTPTPGPTACSQYTPSTVIPTGFASPYDVVSSPTTNLIQTTCDTASVKVGLGKGDPLQYIYNTGYLFKTGQTAWSPVSYTSQESLIANAWYPKTANTTISMTSTELSQPSYALAYLCTWIGSAWKCGCRDSACAQSYWQIQSFKR